MGPFDDLNSNMFPVPCRKIQVSIEGLRGRVPGPAQRQGRQAQVHRVQEDCSADCLSERKAINTFISTVWSFYGTGTRENQNVHNHLVYFHDLVSFSFQFLEAGTLPGTVLCNPFFNTKIEMLQQLYGTLVQFMTDR